MVATVATSMGSTGVSALGIPVQTTTAPFATGSELGARPVSYTTVLVLTPTGTPSLP